MRRSTFFKTLLGLAGVPFLKAKPTGWFGTLQNIRRYRDELQWRREMDRCAVVGDAQGFIKAARTATFIQSKRSGNVYKKVGGHWHIINSPGSKSS